MAFTERTRRKCKDIRNRIYPWEHRPASFFRRMVLSFASAETVVTDVGCGREAGFLRSVASSFAAAYGIDPEIPAKTSEGNLTLLPGDANGIPLADASVDVVTSIHVMEHLPDPASVLRECARILKPTGSILLIIPNRWHPPLLLGQVLPHRVRQLLNRMITGTPMKDTFPTYYRANSKRALMRLGESLELQPVQIDYVADHPEYAMFSVLAYRIAIAMEQTLLRRESFAFARPYLFCHFMLDNTIQRAE